MKFILFIAVMFCSLSLKAQETKFPSWLTDDRAKVWAVNQLIDFMKDAEFYKIQNIEVKREYSEENKCDELNIVLHFEDPNCKGREVYLNTFASLCSDEGCMVFTALSACKLNSAPPQEEPVFLKR